MVDNHSHDIEDVYFATTIYEVIARSHFEWMDRNKAIMEINIRRLEYFAEQIN